MKSKELKQLRKKFEKLNRIDNVLDGFFDDATKHKSSIKDSLLVSSLQVPVVEAGISDKNRIVIGLSKQGKLSLKEEDDEEKENNHDSQKQTQNDSAKQQQQLQHQQQQQPDATTTKETTTLTIAMAAAVTTSDAMDEQQQQQAKKKLQVFSIQYKNSSQLDSSLLQSCLKLFETNMGDLYKHSSWGLNLQDKQDELTHKQARFLLVHDTTADDDLIGFCHFRYDWNDDEFPTQVVLYVYEIQIAVSCQNLGIGTILMELTEWIATNKTANLNKIMLTVFKSNHQAMKFYLEKLSFVVDESSPSQHGEFADYEILSKQLL